MTGPTAVDCGVIVRAPVDAKAGLRRGHERTEVLQQQTRRAGVAVHPARQPGDVRRNACAAEERPEPERRTRLDGERLRHRGVGPDLHTERRRRHGHLRPLDPEHDRPRIALEDGRGRGVRREAADRHVADHHPVGDRCRVRLRGQRRTERERHRSEENEPLHEAENRTAARQARRMTTTATSSASSPSAKARASAAIASARAWGTSSRCPRRSPSSRSTPYSSRCRRASTTPSV